MGNLRYNGTQVYACILNRHQIVRQEQVDIGEPVCLVVHHITHIKDAIFSEASLQHSIPWHNISYDMIRTGGRCTSNYVNPGCGLSRRSPNLEVSIAPGRRAEILIAVTAGGYCLTRVCSRSRHTICRWAAKQKTNTIPLSSAKPPASKLNFCK